LLCITRVDHLDDSRYDGNAAEWDGQRFMDHEAERGDEEGTEDEERGWKSKRAREVYGFGGGISRVRLLSFFSLFHYKLLTASRCSQCEGQHFATAEMKAFASLLLSRFDLEIVSPTIADPDFDAKYDKIKLAGVKEGGFMPKKILNRSASSSVLSPFLGSYLLTFPPLPVGMGAFQLQRTSPVTVRIRRRKQ
jgi:hypothetical protein